jgi:predicted metallopeptidase
MARRGKVWLIREDYRPLLKRVKKLFPTVLAHVKTKRILLVGVVARSCSFMGKIWGNKPPWSLANPDYDYVIAFFSSRFDKKPKSYRLWVALHELFHIPTDGFKRGANGYRKCRKHDIEDFKELRKVYGIGLEKVKDIYKGERNLSL